MEENASQAILYLQQGFAYKLKRKLVINKEFVEYETSDQSDPEVQRIYWKDFKQIRYGTEFIRGYAFAIGRRNKVYVEDVHNNKINVNLVSLYGIKRKKNHEDFCAAADAIYAFFIKEYVYQLMHRISHQEKLSFEKVAADNTGIYFKYNKVNVFVPWEEVVVREYAGYFFLQYSSIPEQAVKISYLEDWNSIIIYALVKTTLKMLATPDPPSA
jgi:hypothetical protein